jgi:CBS domain-containing protein
MKELTVLQAKRFGTYSCRADDPLLDAAAQMTQRNISALIVTDEDGYLQGILTRTDLVRACYQQDRWANRLVSEYMSRHVVTVRPDEPLVRVMELLLDKHIHRVVVVRDEGAKQRPIAVLSAADLVYHMMQEQAEE